MCEISLTSNFSQLCDLHLQGRRKAYCRQPLYSPECQKKLLKTTLYNTLFSHIRGRHCQHLPKNKCVHFTELDQLYSHVYSLRSCRKFDDANQLEKLVEEIFDKDEDRDHTKAVMRLLLHLANTSTREQPACLGHVRTTMPIVFPEKGVPQVLPSGPLFYGDTAMTRQDDLQYMHYPRYIFEVPGLSVSHQKNLHGVDSWEILDSKVFEMLPGQGLAGQGFFSVENIADDAYLQGVRDSMFGALVHPTTCSLNVKLDLPELPDTWDEKKLQYNVPKLFRPKSADEGFVDTTPSLASSVTDTPDSSGFEEDIWEVALHQPACKYYVWERVGKPPQPTEKHYITEAGTKAFDELYHITCHRLYLLDPSIPQPKLHSISMQQLVKDVLNLLIGVPSRIFCIRQNSEIFHMAEGVHLPGTSPEGLQQACRCLMECGTNYRRLVNFAHPPQMDSLYRAGLVFQAFTGAVRKYLQHYRGCVLSIPATKTLMELSFIFNKVRLQIKYLAELCKCAPTSQPKEPEDTKTFPTGVALVSYLYQEALDAGGSQHYPMVLSLLHTACGPYVMFVQDWVFQGVCRDLFGEFLIQVNEDYLRFRDKHYWTHGYVMTTEDVTQSVPLFLQDLANDIFICGKSINLLRLCAPQHFLFSLEIDAPRVTILFSEEDLNSVDRICESYLARAQAIARQMTLSREEKLKRAEKAKHDLMVRARVTASKEIDRLQAKINARLRAADSKKRQEFARLKEQMVQDLQRRANERQTEKDEDAARVAATTRQELLEAQVEDELEQQAREELVEYYAKLTEEAAYREQKAWWRIQRHKLDEARINFMQADEAALLLELKEHPVLIEDVPDSDMPRWAEEGISRDRPLEVKEESNPLPRWAEEGLKHPTPAFGLDNIAPDNLPSWAKKGLSDTNDEPLVVHDVIYAEEKQGDRDHKAMSDGTDSNDTPKSAGDKVRQFLKRPPFPGQPKAIVKLNPSMHATKESGIELITKVSVKPVGSKNILEESESQEARTQVKGVKDSHISKQSQGQEEQKSGIKLSTHMSSTKQSEPAPEQGSQIKIIKGQHSSRQSTKSKEWAGSGVRTFGDRNANLPSRPHELPVVRRSVYGHASQLSHQEYSILAPRLSRRSNISAFKESDWTSFQVKRLRRRVEEQSVDKQSEETDGAAFHPRIKMSNVMSATTESEYIDFDSIRVQRFKGQNIYGHASDSSVQQLLYGAKLGIYGQQIKEMDKDKPEEISKDIELWMDSQLEPYITNYDILNDPPMVDLMANIAGSSYMGLGDYGISTAADISAHDFVSLPSLLRRSVTAPLLAQITLVNQSVVNYFVGDLAIEKHFCALRSFFLMQDGEFGQSLSDQLFEKLATNPLPHEMLNPMYLNNVLSRAFRTSLQGDSQYASNISFALKYIPHVLQQNAANALDCLELSYKVEWPVNIIITESCLAKYSRVFSFMLQLKRTVWVLKDVWHKLKTDAVMNNASNAPQFRKLQLCRHEMQHFVKMIQGYIANQIIHVSWQEFQEALSQTLHDMDHLHNCHGAYLNNCLFRCLLNKKAAPVMKIIQDIFCLILKFRTQLVSRSWSYCQTETGSQEIQHPAFDNLCGTYKAFKDYSKFLFTVVNKLAMRGYQPHLQELLLRLNFNKYYKQTQ